MARYISKFRKYSVTVLPQREQPLVIDGVAQVRVLPPVEADFVIGDVTDWERAEAMSRFSFNGVAEDEDLRLRLSGYDTELQAKQRDWDEATKAKVEARLAAHPAHGIEFFKVEKPLAELPYGPYPKHRNVQGKRTVEHVIADIQAAIAEGYATADQVIAYERDHGDEHSDAIITALAAPAEAEEELIEA